MITNVFSYFFFKCRFLYSLILDEIKLLFFLD